MAAEHARKELKEDGARRCAMEKLVLAVTNSAKVRRGRSRNESLTEERAMDGAAVAIALGLAHLMPVDANHLVVFREVTGLSERPPTARLEWGCRTVVDKRRGMRQREPVMGGGGRMDVSRSIHQQNIQT